jgi:ADP-ribosylglycohydrolase
MQPEDRALGCFQAMMIADAMSYPSMMRGRYMTLPWIDRTMHKIEAHALIHRNTKPILPFVWHKSEMLKPTPTYASEFALFTATMLNELPYDASLEQISEYWQEHFVAHEQDIRSGVAERSAIENYKLGYAPPVTGNDHPHTYDDGFVPRSIAIGLYAYNQPELMESLLEKDGCVTHADEGILAGKAMAAAIAAGMNGASPTEMMEAGIGKLPAQSWVGTFCAEALDIAQLYDHQPFAAIPALDAALTSRIYNYGNIAAETLAVAFGLFLLCEGNLQKALPLSFTFPRLADSVPAFVGALCGVYEGRSAIPESYGSYLHAPQGVCIPTLKDADMELTIRRLVGAEGSDRHE